MAPNSVTPEKTSSSDLTWDPDGYAKNAGFVPALGQPVLDLLDLKKGECVLDLGCGDGVLTEEIAALGCVVTGVDASEAQVRAARARGLDAHVMDGAKLMFDNQFDAVFSNAALHWMRPPDAVLSGVFAAMKPGARFAAEMGGKDNVEILQAALERAFSVRGLSTEGLYQRYFPDEEEYGDLLKDAGFEIASIERFSRPTPLPGDVWAWYETFSADYLERVSDADKPRLIDEVREAVRGDLLGTDGIWRADYVRLRFLVRKPS